MEITFHITEEKFKEGIWNIVNKLKYFNEGVTQLLCLIVFIYVFFVKKNEFNSILIPLITSFVLIIVFAVLIHYIFQSVQPKLYVNFIKKRNQHNIGKISLFLVDDFIKVVSQDKTTLYKKNKVLRVKEMDFGFCIIMARNNFIIIPKISGVTNINEEHYNDTLSGIIKEIEKNAKFKLKKR
ncbi:hypothetical protein ACFCYN_20590 [Gottfriedia sp. NPDC056225]|uniref:hypothetical protein n=1 Tax=Gottfriedia sp. NPDC056225 TaxID=3345751 RepID=UPI0035DBA5CB